jgi:hypothetical protein
MARVKSLEETEREIVVEAHGEVGTTAREAPDGGRDEAHVVSENDGVVLSRGDSGGSACDDASSDESL